MVEIHRAKYSLCPVCQVETGQQNPMSSVFGIGEGDIEAATRSPEGLVDLFKRTALPGLGLCKTHGLVDMGAGGHPLKTFEKPEPKKAPAVKEVLDGESGGPANEVLPLPNLSKIRELQERKPETDMEKLRQLANKYLPFRGS